MSEPNYFEHVCQDTIPTKPGEEDVTATDMISQAVEEIVDNIEHAFDQEDQEKT
ncbi:hypothetical protein [Paenibacillus hexagrammi]|uniref:Uncharacterized protein n=1 Tax=Paenibacillus hexagrammi TaxID=2908839 RepID=A0ABY3SP26_9BACL|nr:hypothetical protein [Paenibacillus sp. YPD9-1]UJF34989.1 hypothetical protein L0M14_07565 [Paenibacillus sp. YPD9-1]